MKAPLARLPMKGWVPVFVLVASLLATAVASLYVYNSSREKDEMQFRRATLQTRELIAKRVETYIALLRGAAGLFAASREVEGPEFGAFVDRMRLGEFYPGTLGIGFSRRLARHEIDGFLAEMAAAGRPGFTVWPAGDRPEYHTIQYLEPLNSENLRAVGFDMFTEPARRIAMERARDDGVPAATGLVHLVQDRPGPARPGFLIYLPVYRGGRVPATVEERREALLGFTYSPLRADEVLAGVFGPDWSSPGADPRIDFEIYDGVTPGPLGLMHRSLAGTARGPVLRRVDSTDVAGRTWTFVFTAPRGSFADSERRLVPMFAGGGLLLSLGMFWLVRAEAATRRRAQESESLHRAVVETAVDGIITIDASGSVRTMNPAAERIFGYRADEVAGRNVNVLMPEPYRGEHDAYLARYHRTGERRIIGLGREVRGRRKDGGEFPLELSVSETRLGRATIYTGIVRDITERKNAENALRESEARFRLMADAAPVLIWLAGTDRLLNWVNKRWLEFTGRPMEQELGKGWMAGVHPDDRDRCVATFNASFDRHEPFRMDYRLRRGDGQYRWLVDTGVPVYAPDGSFAGYIGSLTDITDRKLAEETLARQASELARSNAELANFAHVAAHDLKEPLRGIRHYSTFLLEDYQDLLDDPGRQKLRTLDSLAKRMHDLLDALLQVAQVGETPLSRVPTDMNDVLEHVWRDLQRLIREASAEILTVSTLPTVDCDPVLAGQVLSNLVVNGIKYNDAERPRVEVGAITGGATPIFYVRDNGIGIARASQEAIFRMFKRLHGRDHYGGGSGAGLAIAKKIIERHGGRIWLESEPGKGSTFFFTLAPGGDNGAAAGANAAAATPALPPGRS